MRRSVFGALWLAIAAALSACDGGSVFGETATAPGTGTTPPPGGTPPAPVIQLGSFSGTTFNARVIAISPASATTTGLSAGGSATLTVSLVDTANSNAPVTTVASVSFSSPCISSGDSSLSANPASLSTGTATVTYTYSGAACGASDLISATAVTSAGTVSADGTVVLVTSPATSVQFISATPTNIGLQGSGQPDTSQVIFAVTNAAGGPVEGQVVNFALDNTAGGITLSPSTATPPTTATGTTGASGQVSISVRAGTVPTSVIVTASLVDNLATAGVDESTIPPAQSGSLVISTGRADQDSFSMSIGCFNIEGDEYDGVQTSVNIIASDRFNNPVPDGTTISFASEGGTIQPNCFTADGACSVQFTSAEPRLADHRATILAYAIGEESFTDSNGNGYKDTGEQSAAQQLPDAFVNVNENFDASGRPTFDIGLDILKDFGNPPNGAFDDVNALFNGPLCNAECDTAQTSIYVRRSAVIVMSGSGAAIAFAPSSFVDSNTNGVFDSGDFVDLSNGAVSVVVAVGDNQDQPMPGETSIVGSLTNGVGIFAGDASFTQLCTANNGPSLYTFVLTPVTGHQDASGTFNLKVTTPKGIVTQSAITVVDSTVPAPIPPPPAPVGSISFVSATPTTIGIQGTGLGETSTVKFQVLSELGGALAGETVDFELSTTVGGITLSPASDVSDSSGFVQTTVKSGTIHTSVRVRAASDSNAAVSAQSDNLVITTGFPDQNSFSLSVSCANVEALDIDNQTVSVNLLAADRFNNPVADGTAIAFTTEGGAIVGNCETSAGACSVNWRSQDPRPADGRSTILATAIGEESFTDLNGDGVHQTTEQPPSEDIGEAFRDDNESGGYNAGAEEFLDFDNDGVRDGPSGSFTGVLCDTGCDSTSKLHVRDSLVIVMSGSNPDVDTTSLVSDVSCSGGGCVYTPGSRTFSVDDNGLALIEFIVRDVNDQPLPRGSTVLVNASGSAGAFIGTISYTKPCTIDDSVAGNTYPFAFDAADVGTGVTQSGIIELRVTVPSGLTTIYTFTVNTGPG